MPVADSVYLVVGNFPPFNHRIWRGALFESETAAEAAFHAYIADSCFAPEDMPSFVGTIRVDLPAEEGGALSAERIAACLKACDGLPTEELQGMNATNSGTLTVAYETCGKLWGWHHIDIIGGHVINGARAVESINDVGGDLEYVVAWERDAGSAP